MSLTASQHIKRMRGGANAHLMLASDGQHYVVKFRNNPQHRRILINELVCYVLLEHLNLPTPGWELVEVNQDLIEMSPGLTMEDGCDPRACEAGLQFGSRYPVDPVRKAVYDYVPLSLLRRVANIESFCGMLVFDKWVSNADGRQAIFFRDQASNWRAQHEGCGSAPRSLVYVVKMIDHGFAFNAQKWEFVDSPERGLYTRCEVYESVNGFQSFEPWLSRIQDFPSSVLESAYQRVPSQWLDGDADQLESVLERLYSRRSRVPELVRSAKQYYRDPFPHWA